jgi:hypothetical protein
MSVCPVSGSTSTSQIWQPAGNVKLVGSLVDAVVDDFRHMIGEEKLKQDPVVNISTTVNHSKDVVIQNAVGDNNRQSVEQRSLLDALDKLLSSQEFKNLTYSPCSSACHKSTSARSTGRHERVST